MTAPGLSAGRSWPDLLASALVGTDRRGPATSDAARALLDEAAAWTVYRRAGRRPVPDLPAPVAAPVEVLPLVPPAAAARLALLADPEPLGGGILDATSRTALLSEWLTAVIARGRRVPPEYLPDLFDAARRLSHLRPLVVAAGGARVGWLAAQNPEWTFLTATRDESAATDPATWLDGTLGQRTGYLAARRRDDPAGARTMLVDEWSTLNPEERAQFLGVLAVRLEPDDEELLERALDDRRREVRTAAAGLLARLPGSAYRARAADRVRAVLSVDNGRTVVTPPAACDPAMRRDGIEPRPPARTGERAWWLRQILARAPLPLDHPPATILSTDDEWGDELRRGLAQAAIDQSDPGWAGALLDAMVPRLRTNDPDWPLVDALYAALSPDDLVRRVTAALREGLGRHTARMLEVCPAPWPAPLATAALAAFEAHARRDTATGKIPYDLYTVARVAALRLPPEFAPQATAAADRWRADRPEHGRVDVFERLAAILHVRAEMIQEIA